MLSVFFAANPTAKWIVYAVVVAFLFGSGLYLGHTYTKNDYEAKAAEQLRVEIEKHNKQAKIDLENAVKANQILNDIRSKGIVERVKIRTVIEKHVEFKEMEIPQDVVDVLNEAAGY